MPGISTHLTSLQKFSSPSNFKINFSYFSYLFYFILLFYDSARLNLLFLLLNYYWAFITLLIKLNGRHLFLLPSPVIIESKDHGCLYLNPLLILTVWYAE